MSLMIRILTAFTALAFAVSAHATIVRFETSEGSFDVNLFDLDTPVTVAKFLGYVRAGEYDGSFIHRSEPGFVVQGGGFIYDADTASIREVTALAPSLNEPVFSNVRATIAMAKLPGLPNSATNQWFINLADNAANLDAQNEGFTVFGQVIGDGMATVDTIASLETFDLFDNFLSTAFIQVPLRDFTEVIDPDTEINVPPTADNVVEIYSVTVIDDTEDSALSLSPTVNTSAQSDDGGGSTGMVLVLGLAATLMLRVRRKLKR